LIQGVAAAGNPIGNNDLGGNGYSFENKDGSFSGATKMTQELMTDADFLPTMEIKLVQGRNFSNQMPTDQYGSALINETLAKELGWTDAIGKHLQFNIDDKGTKGQRTVIGVINDFHTYSLQHKVEPLVMVMPPSDPSKDNLYVRIAKGKTAEGMAMLDKIYRQFDSKHPIDYNFLDKNFAKQYAVEEKQGQIALVFTVLAVLIACLGLFGLATFTAAQRTKEIGIRKVLGASVHTIVGLLSKEFIKLVVIASVIAIPIAWWAMNRWLDDFAYRTPIAAWVFLLAGLMALCVAVITVSFQAIRAALANAVKSLRAE
jgi:putative ABC transport system permease protein